MYVFYHVPLVDTRPFIAGGSYRHSYPRRESTAEFLRFFGGVNPKHLSKEQQDKRARYLRELRKWFDNELVADARRAIRLNGLRYDDPQNPFDLFSLARVLSFRDEVRGRFEMLLHLHTNMHTLDEERLRAIAARILNLDVGVHLPEGYRATRLRSAGASLARLYLYARTERRAYQQAKTEKRWVQPGQPMVFIEMPPAFTLALPPTSTATETSVVHYQPQKGTEFKFNLAHLILFMEGRPYPVWVFQRLEDTTRSRQAAKAFRLAMMRLHAEQQCLDRVLRQIEDNQLDIEHAPLEIADRFQGYLLNAVRKIARLERSVTEADETVDITGLMQTSFLLYRQGEVDSMLATLERAYQHRFIGRRQVYERARQFGDELNERTWRMLEKEIAAFADDLERYAALSAENAAKVKSLKAELDAAVKSRAMARLKGALSTLNDMVEFAANASSLLQFIAPVR